MLKKGIKGEQKMTVNADNTARAIGSGELDVLATPAMIALIEETAWKSVAPELEDGQGTVGTKLDVAHIAASPVGIGVRCETELVEVDRRRLVFEVNVYDDKGKIGEGTHERFIVNNEKFQNKANSKLD